MASAFSDELEKIALSRELLERAARQAERDIKILQKAHITTRKPLFGGAILRRQSQANRLRSASYGGGGIEAFPVSRRERPSYLKSLDASAKNLREAKKLLADKK
jgi:hypothetical protein